MTMPLTRPALMLWALVLLACEPAADDTGLKRPRPRLSMAPLDLTSAVAATPLQVLVDNRAEAVGVALLAPVAAQIRLVSWPEGVPVAVTTTFQEFEPRWEGGSQVFGSGKITVTPGAPLEDRWYFLYIEGPPAAVDLPDSMHLRKLAGGGVGARFTLASDPRMTWVRSCLGYGKVVLEFSEIVMFDSAEALTVEASGACVLPSSGNDGGRSGKSFSFACDGLASSTTIRVLVSSSVTGVGGRSVRDAGLPVEFPPAAFEPGGDCPIAAVTPE
jgi:hypothetical protein